MMKTLSMLIAGLAIWSMGHAQYVNGGYQKPVPGETVPDTVGFAKATALFQKKWFVQGKDSLPYRILLPESYDSTKRYPMVLFLHGAGERGRNNESQLLHGASLFAKEENRKKYPAIVVFPQCPPESYWSNVSITNDSTGKRDFHFRPDGEPTKALKMAIELEKKLLNENAVDKDRVYVMGLSMGAMGTYEIVRRMPNTFAAAVAICGGADTSTARAIRKTAFWIFHGAKDDIVSPRFSENMMYAMQSYWDVAEMQYTVYPNANHNSWDPAFKEPELFRWLFKQKREVVAPKKSLVNGQ